MRSVLTRPHMSICFLLLNEEAATRFLCDSLFTNPPLMLLLARKLLLQLPLLSLRPQQLLPLLLLHVLH